MKILIIGGYGRAGKEIARNLAGANAYVIHTAGRNLSKAQKHAEELKCEFPNGIFKAYELDAEDQDKSMAAFTDVQLVIAAIPLGYQTTLNLIKAVLKSNEANYIDLSPGKGKLKAFRKMQSEIDQNTHTFILDAGFAPGLPGFAAHWLINQADQPTRLIIEGIYRDPDIPEGGIQDILNQNEPAFLMKKGEWRKATLLDAKKSAFENGYGKAASIPVELAELKSVPARYKLQDMAYYHAGINGVANFVLLLWQGFLNRLLPLQTGVQLFKWAIRKFTKKPYGGEVKAYLEATSRRLEMVISHYELYKATAIPVVAAAQQLFQENNAKPGYYFMGEWVRQYPFIQSLKTMGMNILIKEQ